MMKGKRGNAATRRTHRLLELKGRLSTLLSGHRSERNGENPWLLLFWIVRRAPGDRQAISVEVSHFCEWKVVCGINLGPFGAQAPLLRGKDEGWGLGLAHEVIGLRESHRREHGAHSARYAERRGITWTQGAATATLQVTRLTNLLLSICGTLPCRALAPRSRSLNYWL